MAVANFMPRKRLFQKIGLIKVASCYQGTFFAPCKSGHLFDGLPWFMFCNRFSVFNGGSGVQRSAEFAISLTSFVFLEEHNLWL
jgi:hypothetical protein